MTEELEFVEHYAPVEVCAGPEEYLWDLYRDENPLTILLDEEDAWE